MNKRPILSRKKKQVDCTHLLNFYSFMNGTHKDSIHNLIKNQYTFRKPPLNPTENTQSNIWRDALYITLSTV